MGVTLVKVAEDLIYPLSPGITATPKCMCLVGIKRFNAVLTRFVYTFGWFVKRMVT